MHSHQRPADGRGRGTPHSDRETRHCFQRRLREERPAIDGGPDRAARNPGRLRPSGIAGTPGQRSAGGLSPARRHDQRQTH